MQKAVRQRAAPVRSADQRGASKYECQPRDAPVGAFATATAFRWIDQQLIELILSPAPSRTPSAAAFPARYQTYKAPGCSRIRGRCVPIPVLGQPRYRWITASERPSGDRLKRLFTISRCARITCTGLWDLAFSKRGDSTAKPFGLNRRQTSLYGKNRMLSGSRLRGTAAEQ